MNDHFTGQRGGKYAAAKPAAKAGKAAARAIGAKIAAGILAVGVLGGGLYYGADRILNKSERLPQAIAAPEVPDTWEAAANAAEAESYAEVPTEAAPAEAVTEAPDSNAAAHAAYQEILQKYIRTLSVGSEAYNREMNPDTAFYNGDHVMVRYYYMFPGTVFFKYAYYDIDGDGTEELLIGTASDPDSSLLSIVDVYGFDGSQAVELIDETALGDRASLSVYEDGSLYDRGSGGASLFIENWYKLFGTYLAPSEPTDAPEVVEFNWQKLELGQAEVSTGNENSPAENNDEWAAAYEAALRDYRGVWGITWNTNSHLIGQEQQLYPNARGSDMTLNHTTERMYYATKDLDGNGTPELLIGVNYGGVYADEEPSIYDVFALNNGKPCHLIPDEYAFSFGVLADGTLVEANYMFGTIEHVQEIGSDDYTLRELPQDALLGQNLWNENTDLSAHGGELAELDWHPLEEPLTGQTANAVSFDSLRADIRSACTVMDYDSRPDYYNDLYSHLGKGPTRALCSREIPKEAGIGALYYNVFCTEFDIDNDGEKELCVSKGVTVQTAQVIVIYDRTDSGIAAIFGEAIDSWLAPYEYGVLPVSPMDWEFITNGSVPAIA